MSTIAHQYTGAGFAPLTMLRTVFGNIAHSISVKPDSARVSSDLKELTVDQLIDLGLYEHAAVKQAQEQHSPHAMAMRYRFYTV